MRAKRGHSKSVSTDGVLVPNGTVAGAALAFERAVRGAVREVRVKASH